LDVILSRGFEKKAGYTANKWEGAVRRVDRSSTWKGGGCDVARQRQ